MTSEITIPLDLPDVKVISTQINSQGDFLIHVESTIDGTTCRKCGREITTLHSLDDFISLRHLPILDRRTFIRIRPKRYRCPYCDKGPTTTQRLSWYSSKSPNTHSYERYILLKLVNSKEKLKKLFEYSQELKRADHYREKLRAIFEDKGLGKEEAKKKIKNWRRRVKAVGLECYEKFCKTLKNWMEEITNYFVERETSGYVEGLNNKIKVMKRRSYGIYNLRHLYQRIYLDVRGYKVFAGSDY